VVDERDAEPPVRAPCDRRKAERERQPEHSQDARARACEGGARPRAQ
jgi:hypothetical protein